MLMGVVLVLFIIAYFVYPLYFEKYVLMKIPEYRLLSNNLYASKKSIDDYKALIEKGKSELDSLAKTVGTTGTMNLAIDLKKVELEKRLTSSEKKLVQYTSDIAMLKNQLKKSKGQVKEFSKIQAASTKRMKELNDLLITGFVLEDKQLARRLQATRDSLLSLLTASEDLICADKNMALMMLAQSADTMRRSSEKTNRLCDFGKPDRDSNGNDMFKHNFNAFGKPDRDSNGTNMFEHVRNYSGPLKNNIVKVLDDLESTISYVLQNKFCTKDLIFRVDEFEEFVSRFINGLCESDDWKKVTGKQLDYILNKPATYL
jgi:hypothetical protein